MQDTLLNGIFDADIRREVLGTADILTTAINHVIALVESKKMARNTIPTPDKSAASAFRRHQATRSNKNCRSLFSCHLSLAETIPRSNPLPKMQGTI